MTPRVAFVQSAGGRLGGGSAQLPAQHGGPRHGVELCALAHGRLDRVDVVGDQVGRHFGELGRVLDDPAETLGGGGGGRIAEGGGVALDVMGSSKQLFAIFVGKAV